jgi:hypothetical protein
MTREGVYDDDDQIDSAVIEEYFRARNMDVLEADAPQDIDDEAWRIEEEQQANVRHDGVDVPVHEHPFPRADIHAVFLTALEQVQESQILPSGLGIRVEEWEDGYPTSEVIQKGRRGTREYVIPLPIDIWLPHAERWCQGLSVMLAVLHMV